LRREQSPYRGGGTRNDFVPLYLYEGRNAYIHGYRAGMKFDLNQHNRIEGFVEHRFEGYPLDATPQSLRGMAARTPGLDFGIAWRYKDTWGTVFAEGLRDTGDSDGHEFRFGYRNEWQAGRLRLRPQVMVSARSASLNNYFYGVRPGEATALRPAYMPGSGTSLNFGLYGSYELSKHLRLLAGYSATRLPSGVRNSPIVEDRTQNAFVVGLAYDMSRDATLWPDERDRRIKLLYGKATDCALLKVSTLRCTSLNTRENSNIAGIELGRSFIERLNGWPLDIVGYLGAVHHADHGFQKDGWEVRAYMKGFWYGLPWNDRVSTRVGLGLGYSYAQRVPAIELRTQALRAGNNSKLLNYIDPSIDVSLGDLFGVKSLRQTYLGVGVAHRSGIFANSQMFGHVNGGSNYVYTYVDWGM
jgi:outer membrane protein